MTTFRVPKLDDTGKIPAKHLPDPQLGAQGAPGPAGPAGPKGDPGATGPQGTAGTNATVTDTTMATAYGAATGAKIAADPLLKAAIDAELATHGGGSGGAGVDPTDVGFDVVLLIGQSNMVGMGTVDSPTRLIAVDPRIYSWDGSGSLAERLTIAPGAGLNMAGGTGPGTSPGAAFALDYVATLPPNRRVLLVPAAYSGTSFTDAGGGTGNVWDADGHDNLYTGAIALTRHALAASPNNRLAAILWHQGETNVGMAQATYAAKLDALIAKARADLSAPTVPFICGGLVPEWVAEETDGSRSAIVSALAATPSRVAHTAFVAAPRGAPNGTSGGNEIHFSNLGAVLLGRGYATALPHAQASTPGALSPIPAPAAVAGLTVGAITGIPVPLTWDGSPGAYNYRIETSPAGANTWIEKSVTFALAYTVDGLAASTAYDLRVTALGPGGAGTPVVVHATTGAAPTNTAQPYTANLTGTFGTSLATLGWTLPDAASGDGDGVVIADAGSGAKNHSAGDNAGGRAVRDLGSADGTLTVALSDNGTGAAWTQGVIIRYVDPNNYIEARDSSLRQVVGGVTTQLATIPNTSGTTVVTLAGSSIKVTINGTQAAQVTTSQFQSATMHGFAVPYGPALCTAFSFTPA